MKLLLILEFNGRDGIRVYFSEKIRFREVKYYV